MKLVPSPDPVLWMPAADVTDIREQVMRNKGDLLAVMKNAGGVAIAAPQVGISLRWFIWPNGIVINPVILKLHGHRISKSEGCLTWPNRRTFVVRQLGCEVEFTTPNGDRVRKILYGEAARIFQHETDHLLGRCIFPRPEPKAEL